jgi:type II secretory pathway pseudopilin PulG
MSRFKDESGFTVVELAVSAFIALVVFGATLTVLAAANTQQRLNERTNDAQQDVRVTLDRMARQLRNLASPNVLTSVGSTLPRSVDRDLPYDLVFQDVDQNRPAGTLNSANVRRVRYCLNSDTPTNGTLYMQTQTWNTATAPLVPADVSCPGAGWTTTVIVGQHITNKVGDRPVFRYSGDTGLITASDSDSRADISRVEADVFLDPDTTKRPAETSLTSSVFLRNQNREPESAFTLTVTNPTTRTVQLNGSASQDPEGQPLTYYWFIDGVQQSTEGIVVQLSVTAGTHTFALHVKDPAGLEGVSPTQTRAF